MKWINIIHLCFYILFLNTEFVFRTEVEHQHSQKNDILNRFITNLKVYITFRK